MKMGLMFQPPKSSSLVIRWTDCFTKNGAFGISRNGPSLVEILGTIEGLFFLTGEPLNWEANAMTLPMNLPVHP